MSLSIGPLWPTWGGGASFARSLEGYERKTLGTGISLYGGSVGQTVEGSSTGDFEIWLKGGLQVERLSLWKRCEGNLEGVLPYWGPGRIGRKRARGMGRLSPNRFTAEGLEGGILYWGP
jgi:hypothetical protein